MTNNEVRNRSKKSDKKTCSAKTVKKRLPILQWLPKYSRSILIQDIIAGITVGLTAIPQGIAYAVVAGLSPEYGLYAGLIGGLVYLIFGSCKDVTIGPTAILSAMVSRYVSNYSADFAILAALLSGVVVLTMGILNLGFLVEFISVPVIKGFTTAASLQIASSQLKALFGLAGPSGNSFSESVTSFFNNVTTFKLSDSVLGVASIALLFALKWIGNGCSRTDGTLKQFRWLISLARNAIVVILGMIIAYVIQSLTDTEPLVLIGDIGQGLPGINLPPFSSVVGNETYYFVDMVEVIGMQSVLLALIAVLESVAIAKAFAEGGHVDATQEMIALGLCNIFGSFVRSMPVTGSFTRTALNNASGVQTQAGGIFTAILIVSALSLLTSTFYFIPKASLAALIITAMASMIDFDIFGRVWRSSKKEFLTMLITIVVCLTLGLEYGIISGITIDALLLLYKTARPEIDVDVMKSDKGEVVVIPLNEKVSYCAAEHVRRAVLKASRNSNIESLVVVDGTRLQSIDTTVASNLVSIIKVADKNKKNILFMNFHPGVKSKCIDAAPNSQSKFVTTSNPTDLLVHVSKSV